VKLTDKAYAAGFLDGEGHFKFNRGSPSVRIDNTYIHILRWFQTQFGGKVRKKPQPENANHRQTWFWEVSGDNARKCLFQVIPYLREKLPQAILLLEASLYPPRSAQRDWIEAELKKLKRINYRWNR
tara:strand:+ start:185 stop:565 length:381 start_codon:yes stop_codon:yes gene_type:complete